MYQSFRVAEPPLDPPEDKRVECPECEGVGTFMTAGAPYEAIEVVCRRCDGEGLVEFDPSDDPYAPDTWKEWEGIA